MALRNIVAAQDDLDILPILDSIYSPIYTPWQAPSNRAQHPSDPRST
jgi:hypothetical protein